MMGQLWRMVLAWLHEPAVGMTRGDVLLLVALAALAALLIGIRMVKK